MGHNYLLSYAEDINLFGGKYKYNRYKKLWEELIAYFL
jgi:hypothetical protein